MPSKTKLKNAAIAARSAASPSIAKELLDQFVTGPMTGDDVNAASMAFKKALIERALVGNSVTIWAIRVARPSPRRRAISATVRAARR